MADKELYFLDTKKGYLEVYLGCGEIFLKCGKDIVGVKIVNRVAPRLYLYDSSLHGTDVLLERKGSQIVNLIPGRLLVGITNKGFMISWEAGQKWEIYTPEAE